MGILNLYNIRFLRQNSLFCRECVLLYGTEIQKIGGRNENHNYDYGDDFEFINSPNLEESARIMVDTYIRETSKYGIDNVALLTLFRKKTATGVNPINESVREIINPSAGGITFRNQSYKSNRAACKNRA